MACGVVLCVEVDAVETAAVPQKNKLPLCRPAAQPVQAHIHGFHGHWIHIVCGESMSCCVVCDDGRGGLTMLHLLEGNMQREGGVAREEKCLELCLAGRCHHAFDEGGKGVDGAIVELAAALLPQEEVLPPEQLLAPYSER